MTNSKICSVFVCFVVIAATVANANLVTFEAVGSANGERFQVGTISSSFPTLVDVTFSIEGFDDLPEIAQVGDDGVPSNRLIGFNNLDDGRDTPNQVDTDSDPKTISGPSPNVSQYFLTNTNREPVNSANYVIEFSETVSAVSLLVYDFNSDGNNSNGNPGIDTVKLLGYFNGSLVATDSWTVPVGRADDGVVVKLGFGNAVDRLVVDLDGADFGTGIDDLRFTVAVPEPSSHALLGIGMIAMIGSLRKRNRNRRNRG